MTEKRRIVFLTGTRADYGKIKPIAQRLVQDPYFDVHLFTTGMHLLDKYGATARVVMREFDNVYLFNNQPVASQMDIVLSNTIFGFSSYISQVKPEMIVIHGDRPEALAGAIVGSFNNILVSHIEGGEISGTVDELIRHAASKLSHIHFVANIEAQNRLIQLGEVEDNIFPIGSPDIDMMHSSSLPTLDSVLDHYAIDFDDYGISLYHPVTTELENLPNSTDNYFSALTQSELNYITIYPNNDLGSNIIESKLSTLQGNPKFKIFPSIEFESFLTLLKHCRFIIGNSSAGIREAPVYRKWAINVGTRQHNRCRSPGIIDVSGTSDEILSAIESTKVSQQPTVQSNEFGDGKSTERFCAILKDSQTWAISPQKYFVDNDMRGD
jgi:UDP-N-acetylglucosamine 2-epimerase (hydrolysing)